jgi:hypothetical protein
MPTLVLRDASGVLPPYRQAACSADLNSDGRLPPYNHPVAWSPPNSLDPAFEDLDLAPQNQHFRLELCLVAPTRRDEVYEEMRERVDDGSEHGGGR